MVVVIINKKGKVVNKMKVASNVVGELVWMTTNSRFSI